jgi:hypothetical protein
MKECRYKMKASALAVRIMLTWISFFAIQVVLGILIPTPAPLPHNVTPWLLLSNLLVATALCFLATRSDWQGLRLALTVSGISVVVTLTNYLEGIIFLRSSGIIDWRKEIVRTCLLNALAIPVWLLMFRKPATPRSNYRPFTAKPMAERAWRFALADLAYPVLYYVAGMIIFPYVRDFYTTQTIPPVGIVLAVQLLVRGPIYVGVCLLMTRMLGLSRFAGAMAVGLVFSALNGIAPLIVPSGVLPDAVRWAHFYEVAVSNFVFGAFVAWLWGKPQDRLARSLAA